MSLQEARDHLCQGFRLTSCSIWVKQSSPRLLPHQETPWSWGAFHLPQPQEQAKGQTGGRDIAKIFPDLKGPVLFYSCFCCTQGSPWPKTHSRLQRYSLAQQDKTRSGHGNCMRSLTLFSQLLQSKALDFWLLEVNKRTSQGFTNSIFWTSELTISVFDLASTACLVFFSMNFCFWNITRKMKKVECMTTHQLFVIIYFKPFIP